MKKHAAFLTALLSFAFTGPAFAQSAPDASQSYLGPRFSPVRVIPDAAPITAARSPDPAEMIRHWNMAALNATGVDHTFAHPEQLGPTRSSRAMAIVHVAIFDAVNAIEGDYQSYTGIPKVRGNPSMPAAIAQAAYDTLAALFPAQTATFNQTLALDLALVQDGRPKTQGITLGHEAAAAILGLRNNDGSQIPEPRLGVQFFTSNDPGKWRQDPVSQSPIALGAYWGNVRPFVLQSSTQFRAPVPPALTSPEYTIAYQEAKAYGGDGIHTPTIRTNDQSSVGVFWAYDGTPSLCAPPRLYNEITMHLADQLGTSANASDLARLLALVNVSMADACITTWESKYFYQYWRPVTGIRESDQGTGPTGLGDGNSATVGDISFMPLGAPASNLTGPNFTPPFPSYPSGHGAFGGALFETLRNFYRTDNIPFFFISDEFNGVTKDDQGHVRPVVSRSYASFSQAEEECGQSRIYLGIHWHFDKTSSIAQGQQVADYVFTHAFLLSTHAHH